MWCIVSFVKMY